MREREKDARGIALDKSAVSIVRKRAAGVRGRGRETCERKGSLGVVSLIDNKSVRHAVELTIHEAVIPLESRYFTKKPGVPQLSARPSVRPCALYLVPFILVFQLALALP